jgi:tetratricopeptide (TPR) repeat protein
MPSLTPLPTVNPSVAKRQPGMAITFSEMEVPAALRNKYVTTPAEPMPTSMSERINIATGMVEKSGDDAEVKRILAEADVFVKYGLVERAADHLRRVFERVPTHQGAHERLAAVLVQLDRKAEAAAEYEILAHQCIASKPANAAAYARKALELNPSSRRALEALGIVEGSVPRQVGHTEDSSISMELRMRTPEPDIIESEEIELLGEALVETNDFGEQAAGTDADLAVDVGATDKTRGGPGDSDAGDDSVLEDDGRTQISSSSIPVAEASASSSPELSATAFAPEDSFSADLEQVDFFMEQGIVDEAIAMLDELESRSPDNRLIAERRAKLEALSAPSSSSQGAVPAQVHGEPSAPTRNLRAKRSSSGDAPPTEGKPHDIDTHADLGIMEKTMERYAAAIEHFKMVMEDPKREVFALSMIGECSEALGDSAEAIRCYQDALKRPTATPAEATQLYYQLGKVFYNLGDQSEALYYFERVYKRDANFRDIQRRIAELKTRASSR